MRKSYEVISTAPDCERDNREGFTNKSKSLCHAKNLRDKGHYKIFVDVYDEDEDWIDYISIQATNPNLDK